MAVRFHPHARQRMEERGASEEEVWATLEQGERFPAKFGREGFRRNFAYGQMWRDRHCGTKQVEAYAVRERDDWLVVTVITRYF